MLRTISFAGPTTSTPTKNGSPPERRKSVSFEEEPAVIGYQTAPEVLGILDRKRKVTENKDPSTKKQKSLSFMG
jgi:hypothetical protein